VRGRDLLARHNLESRFGGFSDVDGTAIYSTRAKALATRSSVLIDFGCGRGKGADDPVEALGALRVFRGRVARVIGLDVDPAAAGNPTVDDSHLLDGPRWLLPDGTADLCIRDNVLEHLPEPDAFFLEARRALKSGGHLGVRTSNAHSYVGLASLLFPERWHTAVLARAQNGREGQDIPPEPMRCNNVGKVRRALRRHGFDGVAYGYEAESSYLSFAAPLYALGVLYQRLTPGLSRSAIFAFARRRGEIEETSSTEAQSEEGSSR
jgi:SAM-dependent methyltransferase